jgi:hypothetical protein
MFETYAMMHCSAPFMGAPHWNIASLLMHHFRAEMDNGRLPLRWPKLRLAQLLHVQG